MKLPTLETRNACPARVLLLSAALALAGCQTDGSGPTAQAGKPAEPPMTRSRAATECWMRAEQDFAKTNLDKRADFVTKCIEHKMRTAQLMPGR